MKISNVKHREIDFAVSQNTARGEEVNSINIDESSLIFSKNREVESGTGIITDYLTHQGEEWLFAKNSSDTLCFILLDPDNKKSALINFTRSCDIEKTILMTLDNMGANYLANSHGLSATLYGDDSDLLFSLTNALQALAIPVNNDEPVQASSKSQCVLFDLSTGQCKPYHKTMESSPADTHDEGDEKTVKFKALTFNTEKNNEKEEAENNHCVSDDEDDVYFDANDVFLPENRQQVTAVSTQQPALQEYNKIVEFVAPIAGKLIWDFLRQILPQLQLKDKTPTELMADTAVVKTLYENILFIYNDTALPIQSKIAAMLTLLAEIETQLPGLFTQLLSWLREFSALLNHTAIQTPEEAIRSHEQGLLSSNLVSFCSRLNNVISHEFLQNVLPASENDVLIKLKQMAELFPCFLSAGLDYQPALSEFIDGLIHHPVLKTHLPYVKYLVDVAETVYQQVNDLQITISGYPAGGSYGQKLLWLAEVLSDLVVSKHVEGIIPVPLLNLLKFPQLFNQMASSYPPDANYVSQMSWLLAQMNSVQLQESIKNTPLEYLLVSVNNQINDSSAISALRFMYSVFNDAREGASTARAVLSKLTAAEALKYYAAIATPLLPVSIPFLPVSVPLIPTILGVKWLADIYRSMPENLSLKDASYWIIDKLSREINDPMIRSVIVGGRKGLSLLADIKNFFRDMPCDMNLSGVFDFLVNKFQALPQNATVYKFYIYGCLGWQLKKIYKNETGVDGFMQEIKNCISLFQTDPHNSTWSNLVTVLECISSLWSRPSIRDRYNSLPEDISSASWLNSLIDIFTESEFYESEQLKSLIYSLSDQVTLEVITSLFSAGAFNHFSVADILAFLPSLPSFPDFLSLPQAEASALSGTSNNLAITQKPLLFDPDNNIFDTRITDSLPVISEPDVEEGSLSLNDNIFDWFNDSTDAIIWEQPRNIRLKAGVGIILAGLLLSTGVLTWKAWRAWTAKNNYAGGGDDHDIPLSVISHGAYNKLNQTDTSTDVADENSERGNDLSAPSSAQKPLLQRWKKVPHNKLIYTIGAATSLVATVSSAYYFSRLFTDDNGMMDVFDNIKLDDNDHYTEFFMKSDLNGFQDPQVHFTGRKLQSLNSPELSDSDLMRTPKEILHTLGFNIAESDELYVFYGETTQALLRKTEDENKQVNELTFLRKIDCLLINAQQDIIENQIKAKKLTNLDALGKINKIRVLIIDYLNEHYGDTMEEYEEFLSKTHAYTSVLYFFNHLKKDAYISKALYEKGYDIELVIRKLFHFKQATSLFWSNFFRSNDGKIDDFISDSEVLTLWEDNRRTGCSDVSLMDVEKLEVLDLIRRDSESGYFDDYPYSLENINYFKNNYISDRVTEIFVDIKNSWSNDYKEKMGIKDTYLDQTSLKNIERGIKKVVVEHPEGNYKILTLRDLVYITSKITPNHYFKVYWPRYLESDQAKLDSIKLIHNEVKMLIDLNKNCTMLKSAYKTINIYAPQNIYDFANDKIKGFADKHDVDLSKISTAIFSLTETVIPMNPVAFGASGMNRPHQTNTTYISYHYLNVFFNRMKANVIYADPNQNTNVGKFFLELVNYDLQPAYLSYLEGFKADSKLIKAYNTLFEAKIGSFARSNNFKIQSLTLYYDRLVGIYVATNIKTNEIHILSLMGDKHYKFSNQEELQALLNQGSAQVEQGKTSDIEIFNYLQKCRANMSEINFQPPYSAYRHPSQIKGVDVKLHDLSGDLSQQYYNDIIKYMAKVADLVTVSESELSTIKTMETLKLLALPAALLTLPLGALAGITVAILFEAVPAIVQGIVTDSEKEKKKYFLEAAISLLAATGGEVAGKIISSFTKFVMASPLFKKATLKFLKPGFFQRTSPADTLLPNSTVMEEPLRHLPVSQQPVEAAINHKSAAIKNDWKERVDLEELINNDSKDSYLIVKRLSESLENHPAVDAVCKYRMMYIFNSPTDCLPKMYYSLMMTTGGVDYMIDFSTSHLKNLVPGVKINKLPDNVMPENNWAVIVRDAFPNQQLRYKDFDNINDAYLFATSPLNKSQGFYIDGMIRLNNAAWFLPPTNITRPVIKGKLIPQLRADPRLHVTDLGDDAVRVSVRGNYKGKPQTALVSSHGLYYHLVKRGTKIPDNVTLEFIAPHEYLLRDPGLDVMNFRCGARQFGVSPETPAYPYSPASRITTTTSLAGIDKFRADKYLRGDSRPDYVRNYVLDHFEGDEYKTAVDSLFVNRRRFEAGIFNEDALTDLIVLKKDKSSTTERIMAQLLQAANPPKKIIFSHCRASLNGILKKKIYRVHNYETTGYLKGDKYVTGETRIHTIIADTVFESTLERTITDSSVASELPQLEADTIENRPLMLGPSSDDRWNNMSLWRDGAVLGFITDSKSIVSLKLMSSDGEKSLTITKGYNTENVFEVTRINTSLGKKTVSGNSLYSLFSNATYAFVDDLLSGIEASEFSVTEMVEGTEIVRTGKVSRDRLFQKHPDTANQVLSLNPDSGELHPELKNIRSVKGFIKNMRADKSDYSRLTSTTTNVDFFFYLISLHFLPHIPANILCANLADVDNDPINYAILVNEVCSSPRIAYYLDACIAKDGKSLGLTKKDIYAFLNRLTRRALEEISPSLSRLEEDVKNINKFSSEILEKARANGSPLRLTSALWLAAFYNYRYPGNKATGPGASAEKPGNVVTLSPDGINNIADDNSPQLQH